jgi:hypothetical protein
VSGGSGDDLARLAEQGRAKRTQAVGHVDPAEARRRSDRDLNLRVAIGCLRGSAMKRGFLIAAGVGLVLGGVGVALGSEVIIGIGVADFLLASMLFGLTEPLASSAQVAAEQRYVAELPFAVGGYFEMLSETPDHECALSITLTSSGGTLPDRATLESVLSNADPLGKIEFAASTSAVFRTGPISGATNKAAGYGTPVRRNDRIARLFHKLVDDALIPMRRSCAFERVTLSRVLPKRN